MSLQSIKDIELLIAEYIVNKCTQEDTHKLFELLSSSGNERSIKEVLFSHLSDFHEDQHETLTVEFERIYNQLLSEIKRSEIRESEKRLFQKRIKVRKLVFWGISTAAIFCIAFFLGSVFDQMQGRIVPEPSAEEAYSEIRAPFGAKSEVKLSDGTMVLLNAGSTIRYRTDYNSLNRDLILEGEAYFKVVRNADLPLIVSAGNIKIKATGTEFNVKAYSDEAIIETTLITGKVEISQKRDDDQVLVLNPHQKAIYTSESNQLTLEKIREIEPLAVKPAKLVNDNILVAPKIDVDQVTAWTKNKLIIRSENLESLCTKLQRKYDVTFIFKDEEIKKERFSGILLDETFQQVMDVIKLTAPVDYLLDGKPVLLFSNKDQAGKNSKNPIKK